MAHIVKGFAEINLYYVQNSSNDLDMCLQNNITYESIEKYWVNFIKISHGLI